MSDRYYDARLKPCPFCGGAAHLGFYVDGVDNYVYCSQCPMGNDNFNGEQAAIDAWNRRTETALAEKDARIKELEALVEKMKCCENCKHCEHEWVGYSCTRPSGERIICEDSGIYKKWEAQQ